MVYGSNYKECKLTKIDNRNNQMNKKILFLYCCELSIVENRSLVLYIINYIKKIQHFRVVRTFPRFSSVVTGHHLINQRLAITVMEGGLPLLMVEAVQLPLQRDHLLQSLLSITDTSPGNTLLIISFI